MAKPDRPSLSDIFPAKGTAARPELMSSQAAQSEGAEAPPRQGASLAPRPEQEQRSAVTVRILASLDRRMVALTHSTGWSKQALFDKALAEFLDRYES